MLLVLTVGATMSLIVLVSFSYRGRDRRLNLLRLTCIALLASTVCREVGAYNDSVVLDLCKRFTLVSAQTTVVLLVLSFRSPPISPQTERRIIIAAAAFALAHAAIAPTLPITSDGEVYSKADIDLVADRGQAWTLVLYHAVGWIPFSLAAVVVAEGSRRVMVQRGQSVPIRVAMASFFLGSIFTGMFLASAAFSLTSVPMLGSKGLQKVIFVVVVALFSTGLGVGIAQKVMVGQRRELAARLTSCVVRPLWEAATCLHPDVRLPLDKRVHRDPFRRLSRLTVETHDALRLIREDDDPALRQMRELHPSDPELTAHLLRHLGGDQSLPPLGRTARRLPLARAFHLLDDQTLSDSALSLLHIRRAFDAQGVGTRQIEGL